MNVNGTASQANSPPLLKLLFDFEHSSKVYINMTSCVRMRQPSRLLSLPNLPGFATACDWWPCSVSSSWVDQTKMQIDAMINNTSLQPFNVNITSINRSIQEAGGAGKLDSTWTHQVHRRRGMSVSNLFRAKTAMQTSSSPRTPTTPIEIHVEIEVRRDADDEPADHQRPDVSHGPQFGRQSPTSPSLPPQLPLISTNSSIMSLPRSSYDPRRVCLNPFPEFTLGKHRRTIGVYLAGALVRETFSLKWGIC